MKLAVFFPGIGYSLDMPLLYYSKKIAKNREYEILETEYENIDLSMLFENRENLKKEMEKTYLSLKKKLDEVSFEKYEEVLFISKSIGTVFALRYDTENSLNAKHVLLTPVSDTFTFYNSQKSVVFYGTEDPFIKKGDVEDFCKKNSIRMYSVSGGNHSLETGNIKNDIDILNINMSVISNFMEGR